MTNENFYSSAKKEWQKRNTLAIIGFFGLALMYSHRFNLSIGIVAMVDHEALEMEISYLSTATNNYSVPEEICPDLLDQIDLDTHSKRKHHSQGVNDHLTKFVWNEKDQGLVLGSFFWGYILSQFPGGFLAQRYGGKWVVGLGLLSTGLFALLLPSAAIYGGIYAVLVVRMLQGVGEGVMIPGFTVLLAKWTPPSERGSLGATCFSGMPMGTALTMMMSGYLISSFGWPAVFYAPGILTLLWFLAWVFLVYSTPDDHPTISKEERDYIQNSIEDREENVGWSEIPWKHILVSAPFWAVFTAHFMNTWGHNTINAEGPKYLHSVLHFDIKQNAYIAAVSFLGKWFLSNVVTRISDALISRKIISVGVARRLCNTFGQWGTSLAYLCLILANCNRSVAIVFFMLCGSMNGAIYGGFFINPIDISPNYAGVLEGMINGVSNLSGFAAPYIAGHILNANASVAGWHYVFMIPVICDFLGNLIFLLFSSVEVQPWNKREVDDVEMEAKTESSSNLH